MDEWFTLSIDVEGARAVIQVGEQPPLVVERLAHETRAGKVGLWCFKAALFRNLRVTLHSDLGRFQGVPPAAPEHAVRQWQLEGFGPVGCEANGVLNLNRYLAPSPDAVRLIRRFSVEAPRTVEIGTGYSDSLALRLDGERVLEGSNTFSGFDELASRGWVRVGEDPLRVSVGPGEHELEATLAMSEPFGWG